jgi:signal peptidase II
MEATGLRLAAQPAARHRVGETTASTHELETRMNRTRAILFASILVAAVGCDHATKVAATALLPHGGISLASDLLRFELVYNHGAFLGIGSNLPAALRMLILGGLVPLGLFATIVWLLRGGAVSRAQLTAIALIVGGGLGNWIDRLVHQGRVTDFVSFGFGPLRTGIFNVADVAVVGGMALLLIATHVAVRNEHATSASG